MKNLMLVMALLLGMSLMTGCGSDRVVVSDHNDRITDLERRMLLNEQLDAAQSLLIQANADALQAETNARIAGDQDLSASLQQEVNDRAAADATLQGLISAEAAARQAGDDQLAAQLQVEVANRIAGDQQSSAALAAAVSVQSLTNVAVQIQLGLINGKLVVINNKINNLQSQVNNINANLDALEASVASLNSDLQGLEASLQAQIDSLSVQQAATQAQLNQEGVKIYKCNAASSTERILKINNKFYAIMNRVTTETVQVVTGASSTTYSTPDMCQNSSGDLKLPNSGGQCTPKSGPNAYTKIPGTTITVPAYTTANKTVVTSVKIAFDPLSDGSYQTTDGGSACVFSISGGGTTSSNLVLAQ